MNVSWHQLQQLQSVLHKSQTKRFAGKRKTPKYGAVVSYYRLKKIAIKNDK